MKTKLIAIASFFLIISACSSSKAITKESNTIAVKMNKDEAGKMIYEANCSKCHDLYAVDKYTAAEWEPIVYRMQKKGKISDDEIKVIIDFLKINAKQ
jgi:cytochrome c5